MIESSELMARVQAALGAHYRLERELGHGGMGVVFLAWDTTLDRPVAVKVVHPELAAHASITQRFLAEARMIARLRHPNIVAIHTAGETTGLFFYVMDYVPGESLRQRLMREGRLEPALVARIVGDLADGLHAAAAAGLVHRDVKPENVLLDEATGRALLADFGIARAMAAEAGPGITAQGVAVGTPTYMSPEQAAGDTVDSRSDLYSLGVVAYEMLAGWPPFRGESSTAVVSMHLAERPQPVQQVRPEAPASLAFAIMRALAKQPAERWQTGADFRNALGQPAPAEPARRGRWPRRWLATAALGLLAIVASVALAARRNEPPAGVNPRHSILVLPFGNLRADPALDWLRDGSVSMLTLNLSQWSDLSVVDQEQLHDLLAHRELSPGEQVGLEMARRLAQDAGVWTVVLGDFSRTGDSLHLVARVYDVASGNRVDLAQVDGRPGEDVRPMFDQLATRLLNLSGAPSGMTADLARSTSASLEAYRAYLQGLDHLNHWALNEAEADLTRAIALDSTFGLAYYKLSLTRGWRAGAADSLGSRAIDHALRYSDRLSDHDQTMIKSYRAFIEGNFAEGLAGYRGLLARDSTDADAWYGLGDVAFHDTTSVMATRAALWTLSLRAFKRAIALDADYYLAYEHIAQIFNFASQRRPFIALLPGDSLIATRDGRPGPGLDSTQLDAAIRRARTDGVASARQWLAAQPDNPHAQNAVLRALEASENFQGALSELDHIGPLPGGRGASRADLPFIRARIEAELGEPEAARRTLTRALDSAKLKDFGPSQLPGDAFGDVAATANLLAYAGKVDEARRTLDLASGIRAQWYPEAEFSRPAGERTAWGQLLVGHLYTSLGLPAAMLRPLWDGVAEVARSAPRERRPSIVLYGWPAALGIFLNGEGDGSALKELSWLGGETAPPEVRALQALDRKDSLEARRLLALPDSATEKAYKMRSQWGNYRSVVAAEAWFQLGDYERSLRLLEGYQPRNFDYGELDVRWGLLGQVRLLRAAAFEKLGRRSEAKVEYQQVLNQWRDADQPLQPFVHQAEAGLARVSGVG